METKTKAITLLLVVLIVGGVFITVSAENNNPIQEPKVTDAKHWWFRWRWIRATYYTLRNGNEDTLVGTILGYRNGFLGIEIDDNKILMLCSPKFIVNGEDTQIKELKDWIGKEAIIEIVKIDIVGKETRTIRVVKSITVEGIVAEAFYPNLQK